MMAECRIRTLCSAPKSGKGGHEVSTERQLLLWNLFLLNFWEKSVNME